MQSHVYSALRQVHVASCHWVGFVAQSRHSASDHIHCPNNRQNLASLFDIHAHRLVRMNVRGSALPADDSRGDSETLIPGLLWSSTLDDRLLTKQRNR